MVKKYYGYEYMDHMDIQSNFKHQQKMVILLLLIFRRKSIIKMEKRYGRKQKFSGRTYGGSEKC